MTDYNEPISDAGHVVGDGLVQRIKDLEALTELVDKYKWQVIDTCKRAEKAERERDELRERLKRVIDQQFRCPECGLDISVVMETRP